MHYGSEQSDSGTWNERVSGASEWASGHPDSWLFKTTVGWWVATACIGHLYFWFLFQQPKDSFVFKRGSDCILIQSLRITFHRGNYWKQSLGKGFSKTGMVKQEKIPWMHEWAFTSPYVRETDEWMSQPITDIIYIYIRSLIRGITLLYLARLFVNNFHSEDNSQISFAFFIPLFFCSDEDYSKIQPWVFMKEKPINNLAWLLTVVLFWSWRFQSWTMDQ